MSRMEWLFLENQKHTVQPVYTDSNQISQMSRFFSESKTYRTTWVDQFLQQMTFMSCFWVNQNHTVQPVKTDSYNE